LVGIVDGTVKGSKWGIAHSGDDVIDEHAGMDDEFLTIDLAGVPKKIWQIYLVLSVKRDNFTALDGCYCRAVDQQCRSLVRFEIADHRLENCFVWARVWRGECKFWQFQKLGIYAMKSDYLSKIQNIFLTKTLKAKGVLNFLDPAKETSIKWVVENEFDNNNQKPETKPSTGIHHYSLTHYRDLEMKLDEGWDEIVRRFRWQSLFSWSSKR